MVDRIAGNHSSDRNYFYSSLSKEEPSSPILVADGDVYVPPPNENGKALDWKSLYFDLIKKCEEEEPQKTLPPNEKEKAIDWKTLYRELATKCIGKDFENILHVDPKDAYYDLVQVYKDRIAKNPQAAFSELFPLTPQERPPQAPMTRAYFGPGELQLFPPEQVPSIYGPLPWPTPLYKYTSEKKSEELNKPSPALAGHMKLLAKASDLLDHGEFVKARDIGVSVLDENPKDQDVLDGSYYVLAGSYMGTQDLEKAENNLNKISPQSNLYYRGAGLLRFLQKNYGEASLWFEKLAKNSPETFQRCQMLAYSYLYDKKMDKAQQVLDRFNPQTIEDKTNIALLRLSFGKKEEGLKALEEIAPQAGNNADILGSYSWVLESLGNSVEARKYADKALALNPDQPQALSSQALVLWKPINSENAKEAIPLFEKLYGLLKQRKFISLGSGGFMAWGGTSTLDVIAGFNQSGIQSMLGAAYLMNNQVQRAYPLLKETYADTFTSASAGFSKARVGRFLAEVERRLERNEDSLRHFKESFDAEPDNPLLLEQYVDLATRENKSEDVKKYIPTLEKEGEEVFGTYGLTTLGAFYLAQQEADKALTYLKKAEVQTPHAEGLLQVIATAQLQKKDFAGADKTLQKLMALGDDSGTTCYLFITSAMLQKKWNEVERRAAKVFEKTPDKKVLALWLGTQYLQLFLGHYRILGLSQDFVLQDRFAHNAEKWFLVKKDFEKDNFFGSKLWQALRMNNGSMLPEDTKRDYNPNYYRLITEMRKGKLNDAERYVESTGRVDLSFDTDLDLNLLAFYPFFQRGEYALAEKFFGSLWKHPNNWQSLKEVAEVLVFKPFPKKAAHFVASVANQVGDDLHNHDKIEEALKWYQKATEVDPKQKAGWIGIARCYDLLKMSDKAKEIRRRYDINTAAGRST